MSFAKISTDLTMKSSIELDNVFVLEFMPFAPELYVKIYIYGKLLASGLSDDCTPENMCSLFAISEDGLIAAFKYWEEKGIIKVISTVPLEVEYLPVKHTKASSKTFSKSKYADFNKQLSGQFPNRVFLPGEYNEYYSCMEDNHIEPDGMLAVTAYCKKIKGPSIGWQYIVKVASNMAAEGCHTTDDFITKINTYDILGTNLKQVFKILKIRRAGEYDDVRMYKKWTEEYGFDANTIFEVAKTVNYGEMKGLDTVLTRYKGDGLTNILDINTYNDNKDKLYGLTKNILIRLDVKFAYLDTYADKFVKEWLKMGFSAESLLTIAEHCFKNDKKSCYKMSDELIKLKDEGITSDEDVKERYLSATAADKKIKELFAVMGVSGDVTSRDRDSYNIWVNVWEMPWETIIKAAELSVGDAYPKTKINAIIKEWHEKGNKSGDGAPAGKKAVKKDGIIGHGQDLSDLNKKIADITREDI